MPICTFEEALADLCTSTANLQIPYLLNIAVLTADFLPQFHNTKRSTQAAFQLLSKLDYAFSSLLAGEDSATGEKLPGFEAGRLVTTTDKVRLKGIVDRTRLTVVRVLSEESVIGDDGDDHDERGTISTDTDGQQMTEARVNQDTVMFEGYENNDNEDEDEDWEERNIGSIYEKTIGELGDVLGGPPIGIITDDWAVNGADEDRRQQGFIEPCEEIEL